VIGFEDLNVICQLEYKIMWYDRTLMKIDNRAIWLQATGFIPSHTLDGTRKKLAHPHCQLPDRSVESLSSILQS
jgi:hypothetical protein